MRKVEVSPWTESWFDLYKAETVRLQSVFSDIWIESHHIGSTAIPQIGFAKPIIDMLIVVDAIDRVAAYDEHMGALGYQSRGEQGIEGRRYYSKGGEQRTHHVHMYEPGNINIQIHLNFKQYLLQHPDEAKAYGQLKLRLAQQFPENVRAYQEGKEIFCKGLVSKAMLWAASTGKVYDNPEHAN